MRFDDSREVYYVEDPPFARKLLASRQFAWIWLSLRLYLGIAWLLNGSDLLHGAAASAAPTHNFVLGLAAAVVGLMLLSGAYAGLTAGVSIVLSFNAFALGPAAMDPIALASALLVILGWRAAGWYGLDRWLLTNAIAPPAEGGRAEADSQTRRGS